MRQTVHCPAKMDFFSVLAHCDIFKFNIKLLPATNSKALYHIVIFRLFSFSITFVCFVFVIWQSTKCLSRFTQKPQGTSFSIENTADLPFPIPAITICGGSGYGYKVNEVKKCSKRYVPTTYPLSIFGLFWSCSPYKAKGWKILAFFQ